MDDDLFGSFSAKPPSAAVQSSQPLSSTSKRPLSPSAQQAPVDQDSLKKLKTTQTGQTSHGQSLIVPTTTEGEGQDSLKREREQAFAVTDEMEITAQTKVKGNVGGEIPKEGEDEGLILSHQVSFVSSSTDSKPSSLYGVWGAAIRTNTEDGSLKEELD